MFFNHGTNTARGVTILIHPRLEYTVEHTRCDNDGRILNIVLTLDDHTLNIINIYAPQTDTDRRVFFSSLDGFLSKDLDNIIGGDFNCISNARLDKLGGNLNARQFAATTLLGICAQYNISDIWRDRHKDKRGFTWTGRHPTNGTFIRTRIDKFLISNSLCQFVLDATIKPFPHSDNDSVVLSLNFDQVKHGPGYWHFNNDLLSNVAFESQIQDFWDSWKTKLDNFDDPLLWWDKAKCEFKRIAIRSAKIIGKQKRYKRFLLERNIIKLQEKSNSGNARDMERYLVAKEKLKQLDLKDLERFVF